MHFVVCLVLFHASIAVQLNQVCHQIREFRESQGILCHIRESPGEKRELSKSQGKSRNLYVQYCAISEQ